MNDTFFFFYGAVMVGISISKVLVQAASTFSFQCLCDKHAWIPAETLRLKSFKLMPSLRNRAPASIKSSSSRSGPNRRDDHVHQIRNFATDLSKSFGSKRCNSQVFSCFGVHVHHFNDNGLTHVFFISFFALDSCPSIGNGHKMSWLSNRHGAPLSKILDTSDCVIPNEVLALRASEKSILLLL